MSKIFLFVSLLFSGDYEMCRSVEIKNKIYNGAAEIKMWHIRFLEYDFTCSEREVP